MQELSTDLNHVIGLYDRRVSKGSEITQEQREHIAALLETWRAKLPLNKRAFRSISPILKIDPATLSKISNKKGSIDVNTLVRLRAALQKSIDEILGLPPLGETSSATSAEEKDAWPNRRDAARFARRREIPEHIIEAVKKEYSDALYRDRSVPWWGLKFEEAYLIELRKQEDAREILAEKHARSEATRRANQRARAG